MAHSCRHDVRTGPEQSADKSTRRVPIEPQVNIMDEQYPGHHEDYGLLALGHPLSPSPFGSFKKMRGEAAKKKVPMILINPHLSGNRLHCALLG